MKNIETKLLDQIKNEIKKRLWENDPKNLDKFLWDNHFVFSQGPYSTEYLIKKEYFTEFTVQLVDDNYLSEGLLDFYHDWVGETQLYLMENDEEIKSIEDEEERYEISFEWVDPDGFTYLGFLNYIYELTDEVVNDILEDKVEKSYQILLTNDMNTDWEWGVENGRFTNRIELVNWCNWFNIEDELSYLIQVGIDWVKYEIKYSDPDKDKPVKYSFDDIEEFVLKFKELENSLSGKDKLEKSSY